MPDPSARSPGWQRGFWSLIATQFQGAFSDNALKFLVIFIGLSVVAEPTQRARLVPLVGGIFALPFVLFSMAGGWLADRFSKRSVTIGTKVMEIAVMLLATLALAAKSLPLMLTAVFLLSTQAALFGPSKYGLLPELLPEKNLSWGNGIIELGTLTAIILGALAGGWLFGAFKDRPGWGGAALVAFAGLGLLASLGVGRVPAASPGRRFRLNLVGDLWSQLRLMRTDRVLALAVLGNTYFWFLGALLQQNIILYGTDSLRLSETRTSYLQAVLALGIGLGSFVAGHLSGRKIEYGLIPLGCVGLTVFAAGLARSLASYETIAAHLGLLGFFSGFFVVPINALIQHRPDPDRKGSVLAAANLVSSVGVFAAAGVYYLLASVAHLDPRAIFLASAAMTAAGTLYVLVLLPDSLLRLLLWLLTHSLYRIRVEGRDHIPEKGGALFVCNHMSFVDALLLQAATDRPIRFLLFKDYYELPAVKPIARVMGCIPISSQQRPREMIRSLRAAGEAIKAGDVVCIFAEGQITRTGQLLPFRRGLEIIMRGVQAPIVPVCLDAVWGSVFSYDKQRFVWKLPRQIPYPVTVGFGRPLPAASTAFEVRQAVQELNTEAWAHRRRRMRPLHRAFVRLAHRRPWRVAMADGRLPKVRFGGALTGAVLLARRLRSLWRGQEKVGILLPPCVPGALVNLAALLAGKVPVNLNYTANDEILASCARQCGLETVVTSRAFLERIKVTVPGRTILLEELEESAGPVDKLAALLLAWTLPASLLERALADRPAGLDDLATVIFSSGSTGDPKGVLLTHYNVMSNVEQMGQVFAFRSADRILGVLPFFHSFGFTGTLMLPATLGVGVIYHPSPVDARAIGALAQAHGITFLLATPTFLQTYIRRVEPEQFGSLRLVLAGAEKLSERVAQAFEDRFGLRPLEGYGCTECAPVVAVNTRDFRAVGFRQVGAKRGKIGHPLPGISVRVVDPATLEPLPAGKPGLLMVRGPNVMRGYLGRPDKTSEVLRDGWYLTGDVAALDTDGFLEITDRLSRFSKIGGEMVPHIRVEEKLHELAGVSEQAFAVTGVPDDRKGERLAILHTLPDDRLKECLDGLAASDLPNLWKPRPGQFFRVETLPYLGSGKLDLRRIREVALALAGQGQD